MILGGPVGMLTWGVGWVWNAWPQFGLPAPAQLSIGLPITYRDSSIYSRGLSTTFIDPTISLDSNASNTKVSFIISNPPTAMIIFPWQCM